MISIIISSYIQHYFDDIKSNIAHTCGVEYEIIRIYNPGLMSINAAYNKGIADSKHNYLLFVHEDILFESKDWGKALINLFLADPKLGLVGVAGSKLKTRAPSAWGEGGDNNNEIFINQYKNGIKIKNVPSIQAEYKNKDVTILDGVFLATKKTIDLKFDERLKGFHNYDVAISIKNFHLGFKAIVTKKIVISHFSAGNFDESWLLSTHELYKIYREKLPIKIPEIVYDLKIEKRNYIQFFNKCLHYKQFSIALYYVWEIWKIWYYTPRPYYMMCKLAWYKFKSYTRL